MKILVSALYVAGDVNEGGSSFFMKCIIDTLKEMGHEVKAVANPPEMIGRNPEFSAVIEEHFDLIICSHREVLGPLKDNPAVKVCISQGLVGPETFVPGADLYYSVSEEARINNLNKFQIDSSVLPQPLTIPKEVKPINKDPQNILIIRRYPVIDNDPFMCLKEKYNVRVSDKSIPIQDQIIWSDLCVTLGRGALEAMALGRNVLVADKRPYMGLAFGDGYLTKESIPEIAKNNFSGRRYKHQPTREWLFSEVSKYNSEDGAYNRSYVEQNNNAHRVLSRILKDAYPLLNTAKVLS